MLNLENLNDLCRMRGFNLAPASLDGLLAYLQILLKWNQTMNLIGPNDWRSVLDTLVLDSFHLAAFLPSLPLPAAPDTWDLGAGAGLPGIPLRLVWQAGTYTMIEAREKRALFLQAALAACPLPGTSAFRGRVQDYMPVSPKPNLVLSRAFMPWAHILGLMQGQLAPDALVICLTLEENPGSLPHGWKLLRQKTYSMPREGRDKRRYFWVFAEETPAKSPN